MQQPISLEQKHLQKCKQKAKKLLNQGALVKAWETFFNDIMKHLNYKTDNEQKLALIHRLMEGTTLIVNNEINTCEQLSQYIDEFK